MVMLTDVNYTATLVAAIISFFVGWLWYGPIFGKTWIRLNKLSKKEIEKAHKKGMALNMSVVFVKTFIITIVLAVFTQNATNFADGILTAVLIWFGFIALTTLDTVLWENKPIGVYYINVIYYLLILIVMQLVFSLM